MSPNTTQPTTRRHTPPSPPHPIYSVFRQRKMTLILFVQWTYLYEKCFPVAFQTRLYGDIKFILCIGKIYIIRYVLRILYIHSHFKFDTLTHTQTHAHWQNNDSYSYSYADQMDSCFLFPVFNCDQFSMEFIYIIVDQLKYYLNWYIWQLFSMKHTGVANVFLPNSNPESKPERQSVLEHKH